jgi:hypothetical protein
MGTFGKGSPELKIPPSGSAQARAGGAARALRGNPSAYFPAPLPPLKIVARPGSA